MPGGADMDVSWSSCFKSLQILKRPYPSMKESDHGWSDKWVSAAKNLLLQIEEFKSTTCVKGLSYLYIYYALSSNPTSSVQGLTSEIGKYMKGINHQFSNTLDDTLTTKNL